MIKAVVFDFDGVIADTEEFHFNCLRKALQMEGILIDRQTYNETYLAMDDEGCFREAFLKNKQKEISKAKLEQLIRYKAELLESQLSKVNLFQGITEWIQEYSTRVLLGICSGALRNEIVSILNQHSLLERFTTIVTAEDVHRSKPSPEGYLLAMQQLREKSQKYISPFECLAIEDSMAGIEAAKAASMYCAAITNSYPREKLYRADIIVSSVTELILEEISNLS